MARREVHNPIEVVEMPKFDDRQFYNNAVAFPADPQSAAPGYAMRQNVRTSKSRKKTKTSNIVGLLFLIAVAAVLYVGNVIAVNNLAKEVGELNVRYMKVVSTNEVIKAEINRKASLERISLMAQEKLGMMNPKEPPVWFEVDRERVTEIHNRLEKR
jgi:cell division protein FtsB